MKKDNKRVKITKFDFSYKGVTGGALLTTIYKKHNGLYPVTYRITSNRIRKTYKSGIDLSVEDWDKIEDTKSKDLIRIREEIVKGLEILKDDAVKIIDDRGFSFESFNKKMSGGSTDKLIDAFTLKVNKLTNAGRIGTAEFYNSAKKSIEKFSYPDLRFMDITSDWLGRYEAWMVGRGKSYSTIAMYQRAVRAILNESGGMNADTYPFGQGKGKYAITEGEGRPRALTLNQIGQIMYADLSADTEKMCRDLWMFSYFCNGINIADMLRLRNSNIESNEISWHRKKTFRNKKKKGEGNKTIAEYTPQMRQIVKRWGNPDKLPDSYLFPFLPTRFTPTDEKRIVKNVTSLINKKMKLLGNSLKIGAISTYHARHSFAQVSMEAGVSQAYIGKALSHTDPKTTETYLSNFASDTRKEYAKKLIPKKDGRVKKG